MAFNICVLYKDNLEPLEKLANKLNMEIKRELKVDTNSFKWNLNESESINETLNQSSKYVFVTFQELHEEVLTFLEKRFPFETKKDSWKRLSVFVCLGGEESSNFGAEPPYINIKDTVGSDLLKKLLAAIIEPPSGLWNTRAICYLNAMIQALASSHIFIQQLVDLIKSHHENTMLSNFLKILQDINSSTSNINKNTEALSSFMQDIKWNRTSQEDAFQLLSFVINSIEKFDKGNSLKKGTMPPKLKLLHTFSENNSYNKIQFHLALPIPLCGSFKEPPGVSLYDMLNTFFEPSFIDEGPYKTQLYLFEKTPDVLILHIQANEWDGFNETYIKSKYYIKYEQELKYTFNIQLNKNESEVSSVEERYQLVGLVQHIGSINGGHYVAYRKNGLVWYMVDDGYVTNTILTSYVVPYIMVYEKIQL